MSLLNDFKRLDGVESRAVKALEKKLVANYRESLKVIKGLIAQGFERYGGDWNAMQQYNRLGKLEAKITREIGKLTGKNANSIKAGLAKGYQDSYYRVMFNVERQAGVSVGFGQLRTADIERAVNNPLDRVGFLKRNRANQATLTRQLQDTLARGLIQGHGYGVVGRAINERMGVGAYNALRIARTEMHRVQQQGRMDSIKESNESGVKMVKVWSATLDDRTRDHHQELDGVKIEIDEMFVSPETGATAEQPGEFGEPEDDINCRCSVRAEIVGYEPEIRYRREELDEQGDLGTFVNYDEWLLDREVSY